METKENNNCASRTRWLLSNALRENDGTPVIEAWANVLKPNHDPDYDHYEVLKLLDSLREELKLVQSELEKRKVPANLYEPHLKNAFDSTQVNSLGSGWANYRKHITGELLVCLSFAAFIIGENEFQFEDSDIDEIENLINELKESLEDAGIDPVLKQFVSSQVEILSRSLDEYRIKGNKSFKGTYIEGLSQIVENEIVIKTNREDPLVRKLKSVWEKIQQITKKAAEANKTIDTWGKVIDKGSEVMDYLSKLT